MTTADAKAGLAAAYTSGDEPRLIAVLPDGNEVWGLGTAAFVAPVVPAHAPPELEYALRIRRDALLTGKCSNCGAVPQLRSALGLPLLAAQALFNHRLSCPANDDTVANLVRDFDKDRRQRSAKDIAAEASSATRRDFRAMIGDRGVQLHPKFLGRALNIMDNMFLPERQVELCGHLALEPAQKWQAFIAGDWSGGLG